MKIIYTITKKTHNGQQLFEVLNISLSSVDSKLTQITVWHHLNSCIFSRSNDLRYTFYYKPEESLSSFSVDSKLIKLKGIL